MGSSRKLETTLGIQTENILQIYERIQWNIAMDNISVIQVNFKSNFRVCNLENAISERHENFFSYLQSI